MPRFQPGGVAARYCRHDLNKGRWKGIAWHSRFLVARRCVRKWWSDRLCVRWCESGLVIISALRHAGRRV